MADDCLGWPSIGTTPENVAKVKDSLEKERVLIDIQEDSDPQLDRCQGLNDDLTATVSTERLQKPPITRKDDFLWMDIRRTKLGLV
jgi:hypothetical protein